MIGHELGRLALEFNGVIESAHMGHADFRVGGKTFAVLNTDETLGMFKLSAVEQLHFVEKPPQNFLPLFWFRGRGGATHVSLALIDEPTMRSCFELAWRKLARE